MRLTRQQQIQGVQSSDLAAVVWALFVKGIWQEGVFSGLTCKDSFHSQNTDAVRFCGCQRNLCTLRFEHVLQQLGHSLWLHLRDLKQTNQSVQVPTSLGPLCHSIEKQIPSSRLTCIRLKIQLYFQNHKELFWLSGWKNICCTIKHF